jgi:hypothetical protein
MRVRKGRGRDGGREGSNDGREEAQEEEGTVKSAWKVVWTVMWIARKEGGNAQKEEWNGCKYINREVEGRDGGSERSRMDGR